MTLPEGPANHYAPTMLILAIILFGMIAGGLAQMVLGRSMRDVNWTIAIVTGLIVALMNGYLGQALSLTKGYHAIGLGMWLGTIMWFNVWFIIWPNQKKALGIVTVAPEQKAAAAKMAGMASRFNTMLSIPMLYCMVAQQNGGL